MMTFHVPSKPAIKHALLVLLVALIPTLMSYLLINMSGYHVNDFLPNFSDEISYWNQINTFRQVGLNGGYFTINELAPPATFTHFYTYGPWYPAIYGTISRIIGGWPTTLIVINAALFGLASVIFCITVRLDNRQLVIMALFFATMWGVLMYLFTAMQEAFQQSLAIVLAGMFVTALRDREKTSIRIKIIGLLLISFATLMRLSWAILYLPFMVITGKKTPLHWLGYIVVFAGATFGIMQFANYTGAPGNNSIFDVLQAFQISLLTGMSYLVRYLIHNLGRFFFLPKPGTNVLQTYEVVALILGLSAFAIQLYLHPRRKSPLRAEILFHLYNMVITVLAACALYIIGTGGDYRLLACHLMVSLLVMIAFKRYRPVLLLIAANLMFVFVFWHDFQENVIPKYSPDHIAYTTFKQVAETYMPFNSQATNAWCNTLLFSVNIYGGQSLDGVPSGIGLSFFRDPTEPVLTFKSRYLLLYDNDYQIITQRPNAPDLSPLTTLPMGTLYVNRSADCS